MIVSLHLKYNQLFDNMRGYNFKEVRDVNSGILFYDGTKYQIRKGNTLQNISLNEDGKLNKYTVEQVDSDYKFDSSSFTKALFKWEDSKLESIEKTDNDGEYKLNTALSFSEGLQTVGNYINHPVIMKVIAGLPETNVDTKILVSFSDGYISSYKYYMDINVSSIKFNLTYTANFKNINKLSTITPKTISGISLDSEEISENSKLAYDVVDALKAQQKSSYDFELKTAIGFEGKNDINSTFKGSTLRKIDGSTTYFHNDIEIDSDYKNSDVYKAQGIEDIHVKKTMLSTGEVWLIEKKLIGGEQLQETDYQANSEDSYFLLDVIKDLSNFNYSQKIVDGSEVEYVFGLTDANVKSIVDFVNKMDLDPFNRASYDVLLFGDYSNIVVTESEFVITIKNNVLESIEIEIEGTMDTSLDSSRDFTIKQNTTFSIDLEIDVNDDYKDYEPYETVKQAK